MITFLVMCQQLVVFPTLFVALLIAGFTVQTKRYQLQAKQVAFHVHYVAGLLWAFEFALLTVLYRFALQTYWLFGVLFVAIALVTWVNRRWLIPKVQQWVKHHPAIS